MSESTPLMNHDHESRVHVKQSYPDMLNNSFFETSVRPCMAEFIGTMLFVFVGTMSVAGTGGLLGVALTHGLAIAILVAAMGNISGGHFNPAVTLAITFAGEITRLNAILYVISQLLGGMLGAALTRGVLSKDVYSSINGGATLLAPGTSVGEGVLNEVILTSLLILVILLTAVDSSSKTPLAPLAIGFAVSACILAGGTISGASMNPARSLGPSVAASTYNSSVWDDHWLYWVGPALGAFLATLWHRLLLAGPEKRLIGRS